MGRIHREFRKFWMISSNLIKSDDELMIEIGKIIYYKRELQGDSTESKISNLTLISQRNWRSKWDEISEIVNHKINENLNKIKLNS